MDVFHQVENQDNIYRTETDGGKVMNNHLDNLCLSSSEFQT